MATVLDLGLVNYFSNIYPVLIVWAIVFALLQKTKVIGQSMGINGIISVVIALMTLLSPTLVAIVNFMVPWFALLIIFIVLLMLAFMTFGAKDTDIASVIKNKTFLWVMIGVCLLIFGAAVGNVMGQQLTEASFSDGTTVINNGSLPANAAGELSTGTSTATPNFQSNIYAIATHPKVLGMVVLFAVMIFAIALLTKG
ncbi:MAG: hypothetical protein V2A62_02985 [Candidatus Woesearchaeota archaeon]